MSRYRDPQLQEVENYSHLRKLLERFCEFIYIIHWRVSTVYTRTLNIEFKFSPSWSCVSLPRPTTSSGWKLLTFKKIVGKILCVYSYYPLARKYVFKVEDNLTNCSGVKNDYLEEIKWNKLTSLMPKIPKNSVMKSIIFCNVSPDKFPWCQWCITCMVFRFFWTCPKW